MKITNLRTEIFSQFKDQKSSIIFHKLCLIINQTLKKLKGSLAKEIRIIIIFISFAAVECKNHKIILQPIKFKTLLLSHSNRPSFHHCCRSCNNKRNSWTVEWFWERKYELRMKFHRCYVVFYNMGEMSVEYEKNLHYS